MSVTAIPLARSSPQRVRGRKWGAWVIPGVTIGILVIMILAGLFADFLSPYSPTAISLSKRLQPPFSPGFILGTDGLGRDILSRIIFGAQISLSVAVVATIIGGSIGVTLGIMAAYFGGRWDAFIMRVGDIVLGFPLIIFAILFAAVFGPSFTNVVIILCIGNWARFARMARGETLSLKEKDFVAAARLVGASHVRIMWEHILPHLVNSLLIITSLQAAQAVIVEASLSFFGAGVPPPAPSWGGMVSDGREFVTTAWWVPFFPGLAIVLLVLSLNLLGDWLRDELDPRLRQAG